MITYRKGANRILGGGSSRRTSSNVRSTDDVVVVGVGKLDPAAEGGAVEAGFRVVEHVHKLPALGLDIRHRHAVDLLARRRAEEISGRGERALDHRLPAADARLVPHAVLEDGFPVRGVLAQAGDVVRPRVGHDAHLDVAEGEILKVAVEAVLCRVVWCGVVCDGRSTW